MSSIEVFTEKISEYETKSTIKGIDISLVNSLRRIVINEIPTMALDLIFIEINSSIMHDEFLAHRLGLIPLFSENVDEFRYTRECECETYCSKCSWAFSLDVHAFNEPINVFSTDLVNFVGNEKCSNKPVSPIHFSGSENSENLKPILLTRLNPGQRIKLIGIAKKGIGKEHAKWSPVSVVKIKREKEILIDLEKLNYIIDGKSKNEILKEYSEIFQFDNLKKNLIFKEIFNCGRISFSKKNLTFLIELLIERKINPFNIIKTNNQKNCFEFYIESTGVLKCKYIFQKSIQILKEKLNLIGIHLEKIA